MDLSEEEEVVGLPGPNGPANKRYRTEGGAKGAAARNGGSGAGSNADLAAIQGHLPTMVGSGEHAQPLMEAMVQGMRDLAMDVADLKGTMYHSWEGPKDWQYVLKGVTYRQHYGECADRPRAQGRWWAI